MMLRAVAFSVLVISAVNAFGCTHHQTIIDLTSKVEVLTNEQPEPFWTQLSKHDNAFLVEKPEPRIRIFRVALPKSVPPEPVLHMPLVHQSFEIYQDGRLIYSYGSMNGAGVIPWRSHIVPLLTWEDHSEVTLRVFSRVRPVGAANIYVGSKSDVVLVMLERDLAKLLLSAIYFVVGLISLLAFFRTNHQPVFLAFGIFTLLFSAYAVSNRTNEVQHLLLDAPRFWMYLEFACLYTLAPAGLWFLSHVLPRVSRGLRLIIVLNLAFAAGSWFLHFTIGLDIVATVLPGLMIALATSAFGLAECIRGAIAGDRTSRLLVLAITCFAACAVFDSLVFAFAFAISKFVRWNVQTTPIGFLILCGTLSYIVGNRYVEDRKKAELILIETQKNLIRSYQRFVPEQLFSLMNRDSVIDVQLGDASQREMSILFSDIRSYTTISEALGPTENFAFLNGLMRITGPVIRNHGGFIDKFIGDAIMALFPGPTDDALNGAIGMKRAIEGYNAERRAQGQPPVSMGIGLNTGRVILGTLGEAERMDSTVISDTVNLASRVEGLTKYYGVALLITHHTLVRLSDPTRYQYRLVDRVVVKGKTEAVSIFEIFDGDADRETIVKINTQVDFERGVQEYHARNFSVAREFFQKVIRTNPNDQVANIYLSRSEHFAKHGVPVDWEGISIMEGK